MTVVHGPQDVDVGGTTLEIPGFSCLYATVRASDSEAIAGGAPAATNEDFLAFIHGDGRLAFAVCDGVGQSFMPEMASALVGSALVQFLWGAVDEKDDVERVRSGVTGLLHGLAIAVTPRVDTATLPSGLPPLIHEVLEDKRPAGSQTTFAAGLLDIARQLAVFTWLGDSRLRVWSQRAEDSHVLGDTFHTHERWSSRTAVVGVRRPHVAVLSLRRLRRITAYSDGFQALDTALAGPLSAAALDLAIVGSKQSLASDDATFVQILLP